MESRRKKITEYEIKKIDTCPEDFEKGETIYIGMDMPIYDPEKNQYAYGNFVERIEIISESQFRVVCTHEVLEYYGVRFRTHNSRRMANVL